MSRPNLSSLDATEFEAILRADFLAFIQRIFRLVSPNSPLLRNWHLEAIAYALTLVLKGEIRRLIIAVPPRSLKSICASVAEVCCARPGKLMRMVADRMAVRRESRGDLIIRKDYSREEESVYFWRPSPCRSFNRVREKSPNDPKGGEGYWPVRPSDTRRWLRYAATGNS